MAYKLEFLEEDAFVSLANAKTATKYITRNVRTKFSKIKTFVTKRCFQADLE